MSRKIIRNRALAVQKQSQRKILNDIKIRTFDETEQLQVLKIDAVPMILKDKQEVNEKVKLIKKMAASRNFGYLTDYQFNSSIWRLFVIHKNIMQGHWQHPQYSNPNQFTVYVNPYIKQYFTQPQPHLEQCLSFPFIKCLVDRSSSLEIQYTSVTTTDEYQKPSQINLKEETITQTIDGFKAIVFQHCIDHMQGRTFFHPEVSKGRLQLEEFFDKYTRTKFLIRELNLRMKHGLENKQTNQQPFKKTLKDYQQRISKSFREETLQLQMFYESNNIMKKDGSHNKNWPFM